jgi:hypothetical protein
MRAVAWPGEPRHREAQPSTVSPTTKGGTLEMKMVAHVFTITGAGQRCAE